MNVLNWEQSATVTKTTKKSSRNAKTVNMLYPDFAKAASYTKDTQCVQLFNKAATGELPKGFHIVDDTLFYLEEDSVDLSDLHPKTFLTVVKDFFIKNGVLLKQEKENKVASKPAVNGDDWLKLPIPYRQSVMDKFVREEKIRNRLNYNETIQLIGVIRMGFLIGVLNKYSIQIKDFTITKIHGLMNNGKVYYIYRTLKPAVKSSSKTKTAAKVKKTYNDYWDSFMNEEYKKTAINNENSDDEDFTPIL